MISNKTVAILAPNLMGNICNWDSIRKIADKYDLIVIEDSADTLGAKLNNKPTDFIQIYPLPAFMVLILLIVQEMVVLF